MTKPLNQEEKERLAVLKKHIGPMAPSELYQCANVHAEMDDSQFSELLREYADLLKREHL